MAVFFSLLAFSVFAEYKIMEFLNKKVMDRIAKRQIEIWVYYLPPLIPFR